jgi:hypothetical protein
MRETWFKCKNYYTNEEGWFHPYKGFVSVFTFQEATLETQLEIIQDEKRKKSMQMLNKYRGVLK